ncbi:MAG TPA: flagellar export chaperone FliS [Gammaproteobacteria bacterium]|nr:flagellar export chaperone FliS [Gammaproteobacteria bacterium]
MKQPHSHNSINQYMQVNAHSSASDASPHRLIQMLLGGALDRIAVAKGHMARGNIAEKGRYIGLAISIIDGLRISLDKSAGGEIAQNLDDLYEYMTRRLAEANLKNDEGILDEITRLLKEIKEGWDAIPEEFRYQRNEVKGEEQEPALI